MHTPVIIITAELTDPLQLIHLLPYDNWMTVAYIQVAFISTHWLSN